MKQLKHVDLVFENCSYARLKATMIRGLWLHHITRGISLYSNGVSEALRCDAFSITITADGLDKAELLPDGLTESRSLRERLNRWKDLVAVHLYFTDKTNEYIYIPWKSGKNDDDNALQKHTNPNQWHDAPNGLVIEAKETRK